MVLLLFVVMFTVTACASNIKGSGNLVTETKQVRNIDLIALSGLGEVIVTQGGSESLE